MTAKELVRCGKKIPVGTVLQCDHVFFRLERSNGFVLSGRTGKNRSFAVDLRQQDAIIIGKADDDWFYTGQLSFF